MKQLTQVELDRFREGHLPHRLTLLRTFRDRVKENWNRQGNGDFYRCAKDSALISIRLFLDAMGLQGYYDEHKKKYILKVRDKKLRRDDDVLIDQLGGKLVDPNSISADDCQFLAAIYKRADKELAHLTDSDEGEFNTEQALIRGTDLVERLLRKYLYEEVGWEFPPRDT